jgi:hypothetical protein
MATIVKISTSSSTLASSALTQGVMAQVPLYSSYEKHIQEFDDKLYFANKNMGEDAIFDDKIDNFYNFLTLYKKVEEEDAKKSAQFFSNKFKKGGIGGGAGGSEGMKGSGGGSGQYNQSGYSYNLSNFQKQKQVKAWNSHTPKSNDEKLITLIESYLNKISDESYKKISIEFVNELIKLEDLFFFDVMVKKIVDKCVMDNKYQHLYIHLCNKIWTNRQIHYHMAEIIEEETEDDPMEHSKYYWKPKYEGIGGNMARRGPFPTEMEAKMNIFYELNFKRYFMNYVQQLFIHKNVNFSHIENDDEFFLYKRQFMVIIEILGIMYLEKYIPVDILHLVIMQLLHMTDIGVKVEPIEVDGVLQILKIMNTYKDKYGVADYFSLPIFNEYYDYITHIEMYEQFNIRTKYFLTDCKEIMRGKSASKAASHLQLSAVAALESSPTSTVAILTDFTRGSGADVNGEILMKSKESDLMNNYEEVMEKMKSEKKRGNVLSMIALCEKMSEEVKEKVIYDIIYRYCESQCKDDNYEQFIGKFVTTCDQSAQSAAEAPRLTKSSQGNMELFYKAMDQMIGNMSEIQIDIPNVVEVMRECVTMIEKLDQYPFAQIVELNERIQTQASMIKSEDGADADGNFW